MTDLTKVQISLVRKTMPSLIADDLVKVQPMDKDSTEVFSIRYIYPWYHKFKRVRYLRERMNKLVFKILPKLGFEYTPTKQGCFGPIDYKWKRKK